MDETFGQQTLPVIAWIEPAAWQDATTGVLAELTASVRADHPDVDVRHVVTYDSARSAVPELAAGSDLLVLGRHRHSFPLIHRLGSLTQHAIHAGTSPVEIVPVHQE